MACLFNQSTIKTQPLLLGFFTLDLLVVPVSLTAGIGAILLLSVAFYTKKINVNKVLKGAPWHIVIFSLGMYLVVYGLQNAGFILTVPVLFVMLMALVGWLYVIGV